MTYCLDVALDVVGNSVDEGGLAIITGAQDSTNGAFG